MMNDAPKTRNNYFPNIVLGANDAFIEITGALVGFSFALRDPALVAVAGLIMGFAASVSMAASAFQQARYDYGRDPFRAALYTGTAYAAAAGSLTTPFVLLSDTTTALLSMGVLSALLLAVLSLYGARSRERRFFVEFGKTLALSLGVATLTFLIGRALSSALGV